jgi:DNA segregation ATPase FtsK/SpoIIIE, S-DNA-T family
MSTASAAHVPLNDPQAAGRNWGGQVGHYLASWVLMAIGWAGYLLSFLGLAWGAVLIGRKQVVWPTLRVFGGLCFLFSTAFLLQLTFGEGFAREVERLGGASNTLPYGPGGWAALELVGPAPAGAAGEPLLVEKFGGPGLWILLIAVAVISFMLATEMAFYPALAAFAAWLGERRSAGQGALEALGGWLARLGRAWWDFLRGADLEVELAPKAPQKRPRKPRRRPGQAEEPEEAAELEEAEEEDLYAEEEEEDADEEEAFEEADEAYAEDDAEDDELEDEDEAFEEDEEEELEPQVPAKSAARRGAAAARPPVYDPPTPPLGPWKYPPMELLEPPEAVRAGRDDAGLLSEAEKLETALRSFRVEAQVVGSKVGPAVTMFELEVQQGTRLNKVTQLSQEIAAALRARSIRIIAPIPGRSTIGIEVPNAKRRIVRFSELITQEAYDTKRFALPLFLGMDAEGNSIVEDLARAPHLLIAGTTGSGKSVCINTILASLLMTRTPHDVQMILVDPKMVELQQFAAVPHLMLPVVTDMKQATNVLLWAVDKMEGRYDLFKNAGVRNIKGYNNLGEEGLRKALGEDFHEERTPRHVPYIVLVIDEMADLMMTSKKEAEMAITRLAQKSRAVGIHVIVATQRPSTDVITGVLKGNLPTRIAFQVASKVDSRVILDHVGAEKLLGQGDMLYNPPQSSQIKRVQGALVEDHEIQAIVDFVCQESAPTFSQELIQAATGVRSPDGGGQSGAEQDDMWDEAVRVILKSRRGSASLLQRALGVGYTRASRLLDLMTAEGIVGDHKGSKAREVLLTLEDWEQMQGAPSGAGVDDE